MAVIARLLQNASHADAAGKTRPGVVVFSGTLAHDGSKAVAKVPRSNLIGLEVKSQVTSKIRLRYTSGCCRRQC